MSRLGYSHRARSHTRDTFHEHPNPQAAIRSSYVAAMKLDKIGMAVILREDSGQETHTRLTSLPWTLAHGSWVVKVEGKSGGYDCARIRPLVKAKAGTRLERGGA